LASSTFISFACQQRGLEVLLVNARNVHNVRGRKSDVQACEWLRELHSVGLLRPSFRPAAATVPLRSFVRQRETLVEEAATRIQRMQKALSEMNLKLRTVLTDLTGQTGLRSCAASWTGSVTPNVWPLIVTIAAMPRTRRSWRH